MDARVRGNLRMEEQTRGDYVGKVDLHVLPLLGDIKLGNITAATIHGFKDDLLAAGRSPATVRKVLGVLVQLFRFCVERELMAHNPALGVKLEHSKRDDAQVQIPDRQQVGELFQQTDGPFRAMLIVTVFCGLRAGELRGLNWDDIDFDGGWLHIRQRADNRGKLGPPKTRSSKRKIPLGPFALNSLREWQAACPPYRTGLVFPNRRGAAIDHANILHRQWYPLRKEVGLEKLRWHDLRHFAVSLWIAQGLPAKVVMEYAGHSSIQITFDLYGHLFPSDGHHDQMAAAEQSVVTSV